jgi:predicted short-subunit dehydrogenase-like oxidoreductase (DUF2520 family)
MIGENPSVPADRREHRLGFIGSGRVALALGVAFQRAGWRVVAASSRDPGRRRRFVDQVPGSLATRGPGDVVERATVVFVTVPDDAVASVAASVRLSAGQAIVHTNGLLPASVLAPALIPGASAGAFHPLVAFSETEAAVAALRGATVAIEADAGLLAVLGDLARSVGARPIILEPGQRAAYHAAAVLAAGGMVALLDTIVAVARGAGMDEAAALAVYLPLIRRGPDNAERGGVASALTGPAVRGDAGTIEAHLGALESLRPDAAPGTAREVYVALMRRGIAMAVARGDLSAERAGDLLALLTRGA